MPKFRFIIEREYTITEGYEREFEAETAEAAQVLADAEAEEGNMDCPDDCSEDDGSSSSTEFRARQVQA